VQEQKHRAAQEVPILVRPLEHPRRRGSVRPTVRQPIAFGKKLKKYRELGFEGVQFHDDDGRFPTSTASRRAGAERGGEGFARC